MNDETDTLKERNEAKRLENDAARLKRGYVRGYLLPAVTVTLAFVVCMYAVRQLCIKGTVFDKSEDPADRDAYYEAHRDYRDGNLDAAERRIATVLAKVPSHAPANQLMARIALARGDRASAISYLRRSLDSELEQEQVLKWISTLESGKQE